MPPEAQLTNLVGGELRTLVSGFFFVFLALTSVAIAAIRRRSGVRILVWTGLWSGMFGLQDLARSAAIAAVLPSLHPAAPALLAFTGYMILPVGTRSFVELSRGHLDTR